MSKQPLETGSGSWRRVESLVKDRAIAAATRTPFRQLWLLGRFIHLVWNGFTETRGAIRAAALTYSTLLALIPLLAVVLSVATNFIKDSSGDMVQRFLDDAVTKVAPMLEYMPTSDETATAPGKGKGHVVVSASAKQEAVNQIQKFLENINAGTLGTVGTILLISVAIQLLMTIEHAFNDIWSIQQGRSIWRKVVYYWTFITLGPLLLILASALTGTAQFMAVMSKLHVVPGVEQLALKFLPFVLLWVAFSLVYGLMPNTTVQPRAAIVGGIVAGTLWQLNSLLSALYISNAVTYSKIYGSFGIIPVFLISLYFSWMIVLLGAQVAFVAQNGRHMLRQREDESLDQADCELLACRVVLSTCHHFVRGLPPPVPNTLAESLNVATSSIHQLLNQLIPGGILTKASEELGGGLLPARPPDSITVADVLQTMRTAGNHRDKFTQSDRQDALTNAVAKLYAAERTAAANASFSDLAAEVPLPPSAS